MRGHPGAVFTKHSSGSGRVHSEVYYVRFEHIYEFECQWYSPEQMKQPHPMHHFEASKGLNEAPVYKYQVRN